MTPDEMCVIYPHLKGHVRYMPPRAPSPNGSYDAFLDRKRSFGDGFGFEPLEVPKFLFPFQRALLEWALKQGRAAIFADCGLGKGQPPTTNVLTPTGWREIGSLSVGDHVIASDGNPATVIGVYPKPTQDTWRFWFSDGVSLVFDGDHLHICRTNNDRQLGRSWRTLSTRELLACGNLRYGSDGKSRNYDIPIVADAEFNGPSLDGAIDPYVLGVLLGDGHLKGNIGISSADDFVLAEVSRRLPDDVSLKHKDKYDWKIMTGLTGCIRHPFREWLYTAGLLDILSAEKFIPDCYLFAPPVARLEVLQGLMDTDGYISKGGCCQFYSVSDRLALGVIHLVRSLGGVPTRSIKKTSCNGKECQPCHVVTFSLATHNPFLLPRKAARWNPHPRDNGRWIDRIEYEARQETVCIAVDSSDQSYVTEHFVVTHNTPIQLAWADNVVRHTSKPVLILTPLSVSHQTVREADKFGFHATQSRTGEVTNMITVTNYERLKLFNPDDFGGIVADESSILKNFDGKIKAQVTEFMRLIPYRLLCTATAAPNDFDELGTSSEALGYLGYQDMITRFFRQQTTKDHLGWGRTKYRLKGHAEHDFWRWVCSWARACRKPSDLGYYDGEFVLPPFETQEHLVIATKRRPGFLFDMAAETLQEQQEERRRTIPERCKQVAELVRGERPVVVWCHLNDEGDELARMIPDAVQVSGSDSDEEKENAFLRFEAGDIRVLITKCKIAGYGMNWQHCAHQTFFPSHSFEQYYQAVRRSYRFGQKSRVKIDLITTEGEIGVLANLKRKADAAEAMFSKLVELMNNELHIERTNDYPVTATMPSWLQSSNGSV
jgi:hypothetical protein